MIIVSINVNEKRMEATSSKRKKVSKQADADEASEENRFKLSSKRALSSYRGRNVRVG
jgi:hypothetical protein